MRALTKPFVLTGNTTNSSSQGQAKSSSTHSPRWMNCKILKILLPPASGAWLSEHQGCTSLLQLHFCAFHSSSKTWGSPARPPQPIQHCIPQQLPSPPPTESNQEQCSSLARAMQKWCNQCHAFPCFLKCLFIACPVFCACRSSSWQEGFLRKAAPAPVEGFYSACFCLTLNCLFESQLKTNLVQGFLCLHKGTLQKPGRGSENSFSGTTVSCKSCLDWQPHCCTSTAIPHWYFIKSNTHKSRCHLVCFIISLWEFYGKTEHIFCING